MVRAHVYEAHGAHGSEVTQIESNFGWSRWTFQISSPSAIPFGFGLYICDHLCVITD